MVKNVFEYFSSWDGWYCEVETNGETCGEIIENTSKEMIRHLKEKHNIETKT